MDNAPGKMHPLMMVAAISVTVASLAAIGVITGLIPGRHTEVPAPPAPAAAVAEAPPATPAAMPPSAPPAAVSAPEPASAPVEATKKPAAKPVAGSTAPKKTATHEVTRNEAPAAPPAPTAATTAPPVCHDCGTVESVREVTQKGEGTGLGAVAGGVLGGVLGHQVGGGRGKDLATVAGAVGGAVAGHQIEKYERRTTHYEITVRMDDGTIQVLTVETQPAWRGGERVKVTNGVATPMM